MDASQLVLDFPRNESHEDTEFFVAACNAAAFEFITNWPAWGSNAAILIGPPQSGKSHLARIWSKRSNGRIISASENADLIFDGDQTRSLLIEDVDTVCWDEQAMFHRLNLAKEHGATILITGRTPPGHWSITLPDLRSRLRSYSVATIHEPDDELLAAVLLKHFYDRQLSVTPDVIPFLLSRMDRSMATAAQLVQRIDLLSLSEQRKVTRAFASRALERNSDDDTL